MQWMIGKSVKGELVKFNLAAREDDDDDDDIFIDYFMSDNLLFF